MNPILFGLLLAAIAVGALFFTWWRDQARATMGRRLVDDGARLVDVDSTDIFQRGHIDGAVNIPLEELARRNDELGSRDTPIVIYGRGRLRGLRATHELRKLGFHQVLNMGGLRQW